MTLNRTQIKLRDGRVGNGFGLPCSFSESTDFQDGATIAGLVLHQGNYILLGNHTISIDPKIPGSGKLTVAGVTSLNGLTNIKAATTITGAVKVTGAITTEGVITQTGAVNVTGTVTATTFSGTINPQPWKSFDIRHPNKEGWRLRHVCVEGPEAAIYIRGKLKGDNIIKLPDYWRGLVDYDSITVHLTPEGRADATLYVKEINEDHIIIASSDNLKNINAHYMVYASRIGEIVVEYEGKSVDDYPGDPTNFTYQP